MGMNKLFIAVCTTILALSVIIYGGVSLIGDGRVLEGVLVMAVLSVTFYFMVGIIWRDYIGVRK